MSLLSEVQRLADLCESSPLDWIEWTPPQLEWLRLDARRKLLRTGQQLGKTTVGLAEVIHRCRGTHPFYPTRRPPIECWIICTTWPQSIAIAKKFWELVPRDELVAGTEFSPRIGFGQTATVQWRNGSIIKFRTTNQGPAALASATIDLILVDEPCSPEVWREVDKRLMRRAGTMLMTLTPINLPCEWLHELVTLGVIQEVNAPLTQANLTPIGRAQPFALGDGTLMNQAWIDDLRAKTPPAYAGVTLDGDWETRPAGVYFRCFDRKRHVREATLSPTPTAPVRWVLGIDYAAADRAYGQCAALCQVQSIARQGKLEDWIVVADLVAVDGTASTDTFAAEVVAMLGRHGLHWRQLASAYGDNPVESRWAEKSNQLTSRAIARDIGVPGQALTPRILNVKDGPQLGRSVDVGCQFMFETMASDRLIIHPRCELVAKALESWDYSPQHPMKDILDAVRYSLRDLIHRAPPRVHASLRFR